MIQKVNYSPININTLQPLKIPQKPVLFRGNNVDEINKIADQVSPVELMKHINELSSSRMQGRGAGQEGIELAKEYIANKFKEYGLQPVKNIGLESYFEPFIMPKVSVKSSPRGPYTSGQLFEVRNDTPTRTYNVLGMIKGTEDPDKFVIVTGHYDHLGKDEKNNIVFPGANDDATGIAAMLETARIMSKEKAPKKSVIFAALSGEEAGLIGAKNLSKDMIESGIPVKQVEVLNLEMLGAIGGDKLEIWDQARTQWKNTIKLPMVEAQNMSNDILKVADKLGVKTSIFHNTCPADAREFSRNGIPAVTLIWDSDLEKNHPTYHCTEDTPDRIDKKILLTASKVIAAASYYIANRTSESDSNNKQLIANAEKRALEREAYKQNAINLKVGV